MKKLFYIFAILFTVFNTTAWGDDDFFKDFNKFKEEMSSSQSNFIAKMNQDGCLAQKEIEGSGLWMGSPELLPKNCQEIIISLTNENGPYTQQATGACNGIPYTCNPGDLPSDCNPCKIGDTLFKYNNDIANEYKKLACENNPTTDQSSSQDQQKWMTIACNTLASTTKVTKQISTTKTNITSDENKIASAPTNQGTQKSTTSNTITISGTVTDGIEPSVRATVQALDSDNKLIKGAITDIDGKYTLENIPDNAKIKISYLGFKTQTLSVYEADKKTITLQEDSQKLTEVTVKSCKAEDLENLNASDHQLHYESNTCIPLICKTGFTLVTADYKPYKMSSECQENVNSDECAFVDFGIKCLKTTGNCATDKQADTSEYELKEGTYVCEIKTCKSGYKPNGDNTACIKMAKKCNDVDRKKLEDAGASDTGLRAGTEICIAQDCKCGYTLNGEKCDPWEKDQNGKYTKPCEESDLEKLNAKSGILACNDRGKAFCEITECISSDYTHNTEKNTCDSKNKTPCDPMPENTTDAEYRTVDGKLVCIINKCADGYERNADKTKCNPTPKLSQEDSKKKIAELQENADAMRAKEQSTANKLLGGATMAATGIGGMQAMSAMAEQSADADAEEAMRAYLATFHCNYGGGMNIPGGEKDVQLPGGNELVGLYSEYVNLANDLKVRKNALGMKPGIESESILDSATSGLYDDIAIGKTSGAFTSLARAMMDPNGADAAAWAAQKSDTANKLKTGTTIAGIGAVGGAVGNLLINKNAPKENSKEINKKYDALKKLESDVAQIPPQTAKCPSGTSGNEHPDCTCNDKTKIFNPNTNACDACPGNQTVINGKCDCPTDKPLWDTQNNTCIAKPTNCTPQCNPTDGSHLVLKKDCSCTCIDGYDLENGSCVCKSPREVQGNQCIIIQTNTVTKTTQQQIYTKVESATLPAGSLFKIGSYELVPEAQTALNSFVQNLTDEGYTDCELTIDGYTDPVGNENTNKKLSENRAKAVKDYIDSLQSAQITSTTPDGHGESRCTCKTRGEANINYSNHEYKACKDKSDSHTLSGNERFAPCRRVEITAECKKTTTTVTTTQQ